MDISSVALGGIQSAETKFNRAAARVAQAGTDDTVDLSTEAVNLLNAKDEFAANLKALEVGDDMTKQTLDMLG